MQEPERSLPDFAEPPLIETALGVQFNPVEQFSLLWFGLYWAKIRSDYPSSDVKPPLSPVVEQFEPGFPKEVSVGLEVMSQPEVRCWFINKKGDRVIQVQKDRFLHNWRKIDPSEQYPRYENVKATFKKEWQRFGQFLNEAGFKTPEVNQCEVTYVNHIEVGQGWKSYGEIHKVLSCWSDTSSRQFLPESEMISMNARYVMSEKRGRLHVEVRPAIRRLDAKEVLQLNLTARGKPASPRLEDIIGWLDFGREWIVRGFADFTSQRMHQIWGRRA